LTLDDVARIIADLGAERETLFFERKASVDRGALAKACSASANTYGGSLIVGVGDDDTLVGIEPLATEAQLWVKDTLLGRVLPMPPFRARWLPTDHERGLLLVLVDESATTPHLLTRSGTIYVRNPGSSDPVPLANQVRLLDLASRGERAIAGARMNVREAVGLDPLGKGFSSTPTGSRRKRSLSHRLE
jgi:predicted HTH transcriptional regulator